jgi:hypothetical protein
MGWAYLGNDLDENAQSLDNHRGPCGRSPGDVQCSENGNWIESDDLSIC